jgi:RNase P subunit RPR2
MHGLSFGGSRGLRLKGRRPDLSATSTLTARFFRAAALGLCLLPLAFGAAVSSDHVAVDANVATSALEPLSEEIESEQEKPPPTLDDDTAVTLTRLREFWKRENLPHVDEFYFQPFQVPPRRDELEFYPCMDCHEDREINNPRERELVDEHTDIRLQHGANRFWCTTCHDLKGMNNLRSLKNHKIDFNRSYLVCGQCHFQRQKDWFAGGHGKRIGTWSGPRVIVLCVDCHNPHSPSIKPKRPDPAPERHHNPYNVLVEVYGYFFR